MKRPPYRRPLRAPDVEAEVSYLSTSDGGRQRPVCSGYRPSHDFRLGGCLSDAQHEYPDREWVYPGQTVRVLLWFLLPKEQVGRLHSGFEFTVQEGARILGQGRVTRVLNSELERGT